MKAVSSPPSPSEPRLICLVCHKQFSHYTCPRCNLRYCSLPCYKSHSVRCVESFHRDNVMGEMRDLTATPETQKRMVETLKRFYSDPYDSHGDPMDEDDVDREDESDNGSCALSETTLNKIASGEEIELNDLSLQEKKAFLQAVASGEFSHMVKPWEPWWLNPFTKNISLNRQGNRLVQPLEKMEENGLSKDECAKDKFDVPAPFESPLPPLKQLTSVQPSPLLGFHIVEVLYSYCFTLRLYNGDWLCDALDAVLTSLSVSKVLGQGASPETITTALNNCLETICSPMFKSAGGYKFALALLDDVAALLHLGRPGVICALSELHRMLDTTIEDLKHHGDDEKTTLRDRSKGSINMLKSGRTAGKADIKKLVGAHRKLYFLLCWANEQSLNTFSSLALLIEAEKTRLIEIDAQSSAELGKKRVSDACSRNHVIEEL